MKNKELIVNPYFIIGLLILMLNDFYLKYEYGNFLTGKLSDFAGLLIFPMFIASVIPKLKKSVSIITGIGFIFWKLPIMTPVINLINLLPFISIHRVIDYSDYVALLILPFSHYLINCNENKSIIKYDRIKYLSKFALLGISFFAFCATSVPRPYEMPKGTIYIGESYDIKLPKDSVINSIRNLGYNCEYRDDSIVVAEKPSYFEHRIRGYYQTDSILGLDDMTVNVKYELEEIKSNKTRLTIVNVTLPKDGSIQNWRRLKSLSEQYDKWLKSNFVEKVGKKEKQNNGNHIK